MDTATGEIESLLVVGNQLDLSPPSRYSYLPADKEKNLKKLMKEYEYMSSSLGGKFSGDEGNDDALRFDSIGKSLHMLEIERNRDIEALLSPGELEAYEMRESGTAKQLRPIMAALDATESEYRAIYSLQKAFDEKFGSMADINIPADNPAPEQVTEDVKKRASAEAELESRIRAIVGSQRYSKAILGGGK